MIARSPETFGLLFRRFRENRLTGILPWFFAGWNIREVFFAKTKSSIIIVVLGWCQLSFLVIHRKIFSSQTSVYKGWRVKSLISLEGFVIYAKFHFCWGLVDVMREKMFLLLKYESKFLNTFYYIIRMNIHEKIFFDKNEKFITYIFSNM